MTLGLTLHHAIDHLTQIVRRFSVLTVLVCAWGDLLDLKIIDPRVKMIASRVPGTHTRSALTLTTMMLLSFIVAQFD